MKGSLGNYRGRQKSAFLLTFLTGWSNFLRAYEIWFADDSQEETNMKQKLFELGLAVSCALVLVVWTVRSAPVAKAENEPAAVKTSPAEGYTVHVLAPHVVDGHAMEPYHHYCKVLAPDPVIQCLIYESTDANARLSQVEFIVAKKLTRNQVSLKDWNANWHDHTIEIAGGCRYWICRPTKQKRWPTWFPRPTA